MTHLNVPKNRFFFRIQLRVLFNYEKISWGKAKCHGNRSIGNKKPFLNLLGIPLQNYFLIQIINHTQINDFF